MKAFQNRSPKKRFLKMEIYIARAQRVKRKKKKENKKIKERNKEKRKGKKN